MKRGKGEWRKGGKGTAQGKSLRTKHPFSLSSILPLFPLFPLLFFSFHVHDFHTSLTQMEFAAKSQTVEISIRMFTDDLETALTKENGGKPIQFGGPTKPDQLLERYVRKHFVMADSQRKPRPYTYIGYEQESDAHWVYLEMPAAGADTFRNVVIKQDILMDLFSDQVNLVNIQYNQQKKTVVFRNNQPVQAVSL
jgi:hypothetical protein